LRFFAAITILLLCSWTKGQDSVRTLAGRALQTGAQDGSGMEARFNDPAAIAADPTGNLYVADSRNNVIRRISWDGSVATIATIGPGFDTPSGIALSPLGLIVSDTGHHVIRRINADGSTTILAGLFGEAGSEDGNGPAARFDSPLGVAVGTNGIVYVADCGNHTIRSIAPDGSVTTIAGTAGVWGTNDGNGSSARFNGPVGLARDSDGNLFVSDSNNHTIRKITQSHEVTTLTGAPLESGFIDGAGANAKFFQPAELAFDRYHGALYVADSMNHAIRKISSDGKVSTVTGFARTAGAEDGDNSRARLYNPYGLALLPTGELVVADSYNETIRKALGPAELQISIGRGLFLKWNSVIGKTYQLQSASPRFDGWLNLTEPFAATNTTSVVYLAPQNGASIYRVIVQP
jgi:sugar lactone lactonase YvrE